MKTIVACALFVAWFPMSAAFAERPSDGFAFDLLKKVAAEHPKENVFLSPASARWALGMAYAGAAGETRSAMAAALRAPSPAANMRMDSARIAGLFEADPKVTLRVANSLWLRRGIPFKKGFVDTVSAAYQAQVFARDFNPVDAAEANEWVREKTEGRIPGIIDRFKPRDRALLLNAVYFKGQWADQFKKELTTAGDFHLKGGSACKHPLMDQSGTYPYFQGDGFQAVRLPYGSGRFGMLVLLPARDRDVDALMSSAANAATWRSIHASLADKPGHVRLPRFKQEFNASLVGPLKEIGMGAAFDPRRADFTGMADASRPQDRLYLSDVLQKTFVEVNEEGTEAAAVTAVGGIVGCAVIHQDPPFEFIADRPFVYAIEEQTTGEILFIGILRDPR